MIDVNLDRLRGLMVEHHVTQESLAMSLGMARSTLYRKMEKGGKDFTAEEIFKMKDFIPLSDQEVIDIFLTRKVALVRQKEASR